VHFSKERLEQREALARQRQQQQQQQHETGQRRTAI